MTLRVSAYPHAELPHFAGEFHEFEGVTKVRGRLVVVFRQVAAEGHNVDDPRVEIVLQEITHLVATMPDADEVGHRSELARALDSRHEIEGSLTRLAAASVGHGDERGF